VEIALFGDAASASAALDHAVAETGQANEFRLRGSTAGRLSARIGLIVVAAVVVTGVVLWLVVR
jgi:hypothetical protein